ncbi:cystathionine gamma-lyase-like [Chironomus tepperi]
MEQLTNELSEISFGEQIGFRKAEEGFATKAIHVGQEPELWNCRAVVPLISLATTYKQFAPAQHAGFEYSRSGNPTRSVLETCLASLDNGKYALTFASGLGAQTAIISTLKTGDVIITGDDVYGGTNRLFRNLAVNMGMEVIFVDMTDVSNLEKAMKDNVKLVWLETPTNPSMKVIDIQKISDFVHKNSEAFVVVDNTFLSAYFQRPLELGADVVAYSLTKYMNGHADVVMGSIATSNEKIYERLKFYQNAAGIVPSPFDCYLVNRSLKTLSLRMERHFKTGMAIAKYLEAHEKVEKVLHPALKSHPQYETTLKQTYGHSGVFSFYLRDANLEKSTKFLQSLKIFMIAESLGGFESLVELPSIMTHASVPEDQRKELGINDGLIRVSVGLEDAKDLIADFDDAFKQI